MYSEDSLKFPTFRITKSTYLSEASISRFLRNAYVAVGAAGISAVILGSLILLYPRLATASWPFAQAADGGTDALVHDPGLNLLEAALNPDPNPLKDEGTIVLSEDSALLAEGGVDSANVGSLDAPVDTAAAPALLAEKPASPTKKVEVAKAAPVKPAAKPVTKTPAKSTVTKKIVNTGAASGYFSNPCPSCHKTQGIHGHNGVDLAGPIGTPIYAAADGTVTTIKGGDAWNGGYGNYVVISHPNGTSTLYAHMSRIATSGGSVSRGEVIGYVGNTGDSTGPHLHVEVHGASNPF